MASTTKAKAKARKTSKSAKAAKDERTPEQKQRDEFAKAKPRADASQVEFLPVVMVDPATLRNHDELKALVPEQDAEAKKRLAADMTARGIQYPLLVAADGRVIDGMTRRELAAAIQKRTGGKLMSTVPVRYLPEGIDEADLVSIGVAMNTVRRGNIPQGKRVSMGKAMLLAHPTLSDREIARATQVSHTAVSNWRKTFVATGKMRDVVATEGKDGKTRTRQKRQPVKAGQTARTVKAATPAATFALLAGFKPAAVGDLRKAAKQLNAKQVERVRAWLAILPQLDAILPSKD